MLWFVGQNQNYQRNGLNAAVKVLQGADGAGRDGWERVCAWTPLWLLMTKFSAEARKSFCRLQNAWVTSDLHQGSKAQLLSKASALGNTALTSEGTRKVRGKRKGKRLVHTEEPEFDSQNPCAKRSWHGGTRLNPSSKEAETGGSLELSGYPDMSSQ